MTRQAERKVIRRIYRFICDDGRRFVIYNASAIGNPGDHEADRWYFRPYPVAVGSDSSDAFESANEAERAARASEG
jgi:hypothetical protein